VGHPTVNVRIPCHFEPLFLADENLTPVLATLVKVTMTLGPDGSIAPSKVQMPFNGGGELAVAADVASYRYEPEGVFFKPATDVVLIGHAHAPNPATTVLDVGIRVGSLQKVVRVFGDRYWVKTGGQVFATKPQPFGKLPLTYERAFGGWDKSHKDESRWRFEPRNPVGRGFGDPLAYVEEGKVPMPNLEDPNNLITRYGDAPPPAGFGFVSPNWQPRAKYAGTYDEAWNSQRKPLLPKDFDRRFFNAASSGLVSTGYLRGNEDVAVVNAAAVSPLRFKLPNGPPPACRVRLRGGKTVLLRTNLDTLIVNTDAMSVLMFWRAHIPLPTGPQDVIGIDVGSESELMAPPPSDADE
jgi:hypothetical protein